MLSPSERVIVAATFDAISEVGQVDTAMANPFFCSWRHLDTKGKLAIIDKVESTLSMISQTK